MIKSDIESVAKLLQDYAGLDPNGDHGADTAQRFLNTLSELTKCKPQDEEHMSTCIKWRTFPAESDDMVIVHDIDFVSLCNHHLVPFKGKAWVGYVPEKEIVGLSKIPRVVRHFARQLQVQERMTQQIADFFTEHLQPKGLAVVVQAEHMCMSIRGVHAPDAYTTTSKVTGVFADHGRTAKTEFMQFISGSLK